MPPTIRPNAGHAAEGKHVAVARFLESLEQVFAGLEARVLDAAVDVGQHVGDLVERDRHVRDVGELHVDRVDVLVDPVERLRGGERDEHCRSSWS
jgi:hypothetical protein